jgi:RNA polymerase sigma-70 factor (ECF subfamily)
MPQPATLPLADFLHKVVPVLQPPAGDVRKPRVVALPQRRGRPVNGVESDEAPGLRMNLATQAEALVLPWTRAEPPAWDEAEGADADADAAAAEPEPQPDTDAAPAARPATGTLTDEEAAALLARIANQDERALEALYDATCSRVHALAWRVTQRRSLADEVVEDTYWQVWRQAARFDPLRGRPLAWLLAMTRSRAIDALRHDQRFRHDELPDDDTADAATAAPPPQDLLAATRGATQLHAALAQLDARARQLVTLAFFRGLTHEEIAEQEGLPLGSVKSVIRRALQLLRQRLASDHEPA